MKEADILYIEDNEDYIEFVKRAIGKIDNSLSFDVVMDGKQALELFDKAAENKRLPRIILLDINLPDYNGFDLLKKIRSNTITRYIPVIMFSSSENQKDRIQAFDWGANAYLVKPIGLNSLTDTMQSLCSFWLVHNKTVENFAA